MVGFFFAVLWFFPVAALVIGVSLWFVFREQIRGCIREYLLERALGSGAQMINNVDAFSIADAGHIAIIDEELLSQNPTIYEMRSWVPQLPELQISELPIDAADGKPLNDFEPTTLPSAGYGLVQEVYENLMRRVGTPPKYAGAF